jgi:hypothetical protein
LPLFNIVAVAPSLRVLIDPVAVKVPCAAVGDGVGVGDGIEVGEGEGVGVGESVAATEGGRLGPKLTVDEALFECETGATVQPTTIRIRANAATPEPRPADQTTEDSPNPAMPRMTSSRPRP